MKNGILIGFILLMVLISGCISQQTQNTENADNSQVEDIVVGEPNPSVPSPEDDMIDQPVDDGKMMKPEFPTVSINDQPIQDDTVTAEFVYIEQDGWLVIHVDNAGSPGSVVGFTAIAEGLTDAVQVPIDSLSATSTLHAMLHADTGVVGEYDFPDADAPIMVNGEVVMMPFTVSNLPVAEPAPEPTVEPEPIVAAKEFSIIADEDHFDPSTISVNKGEQVRITFNFNDSQIYFGGLDIKTNPAGIFVVNYRKDKGSTSAIVEFTAENTFTYTGYWPASGVQKATGTVEVK